MHIQGRHGGIYGLGDSHEEVAGCNIIHDRITIIIIKDHDITHTQEGTRNIIRDNMRGNAWEDKRKEPIR